MWGVLMGIPSIKNSLSDSLQSTPVNDDQLDARIAYVLGKIWATGDESVVLLGGLNEGTFLLPNKDTMC